MTVIFDPIDKYHYLSKSEENYYFLSSYKSLKGGIGSDKVIAGTKP